MAMQKRSIATTHLRRKIMLTIKEYGCLHIHEICRLINGLPKDDPQCCYLTEKEWGGINWKLCAYDIWDCKIRFYEVRDQVYQCEKKGWLKSKRLKWTDHRWLHRNKDTFNFFYMAINQFIKRFGSLQCIDDSEL